MMFIRVDLPEPDWPTMETNSPAAAVKSSPGMTVSSLGLPMLNVFVMPRISMSRSLDAGTWGISVVAAPGSVAS